MDNDKTTRYVAVLYTQIAWQFWPISPLNVTGHKGTGNALSIDLGALISMQLTFSAPPLPWVAASHRPTSPDRFFQKNHLRLAPI